MVTPRSNRYEVASGGAVYAGRSLPPLSPLAAAYGDSLTDPSYGLTTFTWANALAAHGGRVLVANCGVASETVNQMLTRVDNLPSHSSPGLLGLTLGSIDFRGGTNDARAGTSIASLAPTYTALFNKFRGYCTRLFIWAVPPIGSGESGYVAKNALTIQYNTWLAAFAAANSSWCTFVADDVNLRDGTGAQIESLFNPDGVHLIGASVYLSAVAGAAVQAPFFTDYANPISYDPADVYPAQPQWVPNHIMAGTGGSLGGGWTGQMPNGASIGSNGGGISGSVAIAAAPGGDANTSPIVWITPSQVTRTGAGESIRLAIPLTGRAIGTSDPSALDLMTEFWFDGFDSTYFNSIKLWVQGNTGAVLTRDLELKMGAAVLTHDRIVPRFKLPRPTSTAQTSATLYVDAVIAANKSGGGMGRFGFRNPHIRG